jgi:hypothetical protein
MARKIGRLIEWSPPAETGTTPAAWIAANTLAIS